MSIRNYYHGLTDRGRPESMRQTPAGLPARFADVPKGTVAQRMNEVATDYNAGLTAALARMYSEFGGTPLANFPPAETLDGPEMYVESSLNATGNNFSGAKVLVYNRSAWPARALTNGSFRNYFTLDGATTPSQITLTTAYKQCSAPAGPTQHSGNVYYVTVSCAGQAIAPQGQYRRCGAGVRLQSPPRAVHSRTLRPLPTRGSGRPGSLARLR
jgi:hypothetical protein